MAISCSIIIPAFNSAQWIGKCLDSIFNQSYDDYEVLIVDDGSTDNTKEICDRYVSKSEKFRYFYKDNGGVSSARNFGLEHCSADSAYVMFVDSDDEVAPCYVSSMIGYATNHSMVICDFFRCDRDHIPDAPAGDGASICYRDLWRNEEFLERIKYGIINSSCTKCYSLDVIRKNRIKFMDTIAEDTLFNISYLNFVDKVIWVNRKCYYYIVRDGSVSSLPSEQLFVNYIGIQKSLRSKVEEEYVKYIDGFVYPQYRAIATKYVIRGEYGVPKKYLSDPNVRKALSSYHPETIADYVIHSLLRLRYLRLLRVLLSYGR